MIGKAGANINEIKRGSGAFVLVLPVANKHELAAADEDTVKVGGFADFRHEQFSWHGQDKETVTNVLTLVILIAHENTDRAGYQHSLDF